MPRTHSVVSQGRPLGDDFVGEDLEPDADEALEPPLEVLLAPELGRPRALAGEAKPHVLGNQAQLWPVVAGTQARHVASEDPLD